MTSSIESRSSYGPVMMLSASSRKVMQALSIPWILGTRSRSWNDCMRLRTDISKFSRRCVPIDESCSMQPRATPICSWSTSWSSAATITS